MYTHVLPEDQEPLAFSATSTRAPRFCSSWELEGVRVGGTRAGHASERKERSGASCVCRWGGSPNTGAAGGEVGSGLARALRCVNGSPACAAQADVVLFLGHLGRYANAHLVEPAVAAPVALHPVHLISAGPLAVFRRAHGVLVIRVVVSTRCFAAAGLGLPLLGSTGTLLHLALLGTLLVFLVGPLDAAPLRFGLVPLAVAHRLELLLLGLVGFEDVARCGVAAERQLALLQLALALLVQLILVPRPRFHRFALPAHRLEEAEGGAVPRWALRGLQNPPEVQALVHADLQQVTLQDQLLQPRLGPLRQAQHGRIQ